MSEFDILFAPIAEREVIFYLNVAKYLRKKYNMKSSFLTFYSPCDDLIRKRGFKVFSIHEEKYSFKEYYSPQKVKDLEKRYGEDNLRALLAHEKLTFARYDEKSLFEKMLTYQKYIENILDSNKIGLVAQELGGFIAPLVLFNECKLKGIDHVFFEPALYKGKLFYNMNSMEVDLKDGDSKEAMEYIKRYLEGYNDQHTIVIPQKDRHHFMDASIKKLINNRNLRQLARKIYYKYIMKKDEEYDAILNHVKRFTTMYFRRKGLSDLYSSPDFSEKYIYFPLHVPLDFQLTVREPQYLNQVELLSQVAKMLPVGYKLYTKEHPASIGGYAFFAMRTLLKENKNVRLINPGENSYDLIKNSQYVLTINSKVGAEAVMQGKDVLVLGNPYYLESKKARKIYDIKELNNILNNEIPKNKELDYDFFKKVYFSCYNAELYNNESENIKEFSEALKEKIKKG